MKNRRLESLRHMGKTMKCPKCRFENPEGHKFCSECGSELKSGSVEEPRSTREGERKRVTALFSDLSGYTAMTEKLDPEEVKEITGRVFDGVRGIVSKHDGFIERFAGEGKEVKNGSILWGDGFF